MSFFRNMDIYKVIILLSVVLLPLGWWWVNGLEDKLQASEKAYQSATRRGGHLEQIGQLEKTIEIVAKNRRISSDTISEPSVYFEGQINAVSPELRLTDFRLRKVEQDPARIGKKGRAVDHVMPIDWSPGRSQKDRKSYPMDFIYAVIFNCESGATRAGAAAAAPSVWRLRKLRLENATDPKFVRGSTAPAPELRDAWLISDMEFARREPAQSKSRRKR
ncbi:MAG: hypothetical protein AB8H80_15785 [Planctomycetota bacterium]